MTIKELRLFKGMTQEKMAEILGVDRSDLGKMENGKKRISGKIVDKIWYNFGVDVHDTEENKPVKNAPVMKPKMFIQSPFGGNITPEEIENRLPEGTETCYIRVDQNLIWWVRRNGETGSVQIWE
ncbi:MAG: helix-turn-helix transcriptional regulator [Clostridia bacterium]|nr:helix-turn-helix transcriptional regulator [Clostridia bacterium]